MVSYLILVNWIFIRRCLWKNLVCSSWCELMSHYPFFLGVWLPFSSKNVVKFQNFLISSVVRIINWKYEACSWCFEKYQDPIPANLGELTEWISVLLWVLPCLGGQTFWGKWGEITCQELFLHVPLAHIANYMSSSSLNWGINELRKTRQNTGGHLITIYPSYKGKYMLCPLWSPNKHT